MPISPNASYKNYDIAILWKIVKKTDNENSGIDTIPQGPGGVIVSYNMGAYMVLIEGMLV